jgi:hypothetical protein
MKLITIGDHTIRADCIESVSVKRNIFPQDDPYSSVGIITRSGHDASESFLGEGAYLKADKRHAELITQWREAVEG